MNLKGIWKMFIKAYVRVLFFFLALASSMAGVQNLAISSESQAVLFETSELTIVHGQERFQFHIQLARTMAALERGLMERRHLDADRGMLFDYGKPRHIRMWMKNTFIPLDMLFIDQSGAIIEIVANTNPHSTRVIASPGPALGVLELNAGTAARLSIRVGDRVLHEIFGSGI